MTPKAYGKKPSLSKIKFAYVLTDPAFSCLDGNEWSLCSGCSKSSVRCYSTASGTECRPDWSDPNAHTTNTSWSPRQNLCYALGFRCQVSLLSTHCNSILTFVRSSSSSSRNLVSASQDGKLIVWDSYTTNKVNT